MNANAGRLASGLDAAALPVELPVSQPVALPVLLVEKPWGREVLPAPFSVPAGKRIGEVWFEPPVALDRLLVKYIFTSEKLSVQVHPSDAETEANGLGRQGKDECWLIIAADPGARLGIGFERHLDAETLRAAALDGSIEDLLSWYSPVAGDFFSIPAGTVHTIGAGLSMVEIQQNSDITYRLYDYGRDRPLHLDAGLAVARGEPYAEGLHRRLAAGTSEQLVDGPCFRLDRVAGAPAAAVAARYAQGPLLAIPLAGEVVVRGEVIAPGGCAIASEMAEIHFAASGLCLLTQPS